MPGKAGKTVQKEFIFPGTKWKNLSECKQKWVKRNNMKDTFTTE